MARSKDFGMISNVSRQFSKETSLEMFGRMCRIRYFELRVKEAYDAGLIKMPVYLSVGQEAVAAGLAAVFKNPAIFGQHRSHDLYLAYGGDPAALRDELLHKETGCARGMGGSASIHSPQIKMFGHDGLMGTQIPIAVGYALGHNDRTLAVMGDASAEEDYALASLGYASHKKAPVLFVCMDNGLSILTKVEVRRNWLVKDIAQAFKMYAVDITDDPWLIMYMANCLIAEGLPAFMNIHVVRHLWHNGTGNDGPPEWDRFELVKEEMHRLGLAGSAKELEGEAETLAMQLWKDELENVAPDAINYRQTHKIKQVQTSSHYSLTVAETIRSITREHLKNGGVALGQCLTAVGWVGGTVPGLTEKDGLTELSMADVAGGGIAVGHSLPKFVDGREIAGRRPIYIVRYQGFQWFNAPFILNYAAKSKDMWGVSCPVFIRSIAMDGAIGPVASGSHHGIYTRMPGVAVAAPMTPGEYREVWDRFMSHDVPVYSSEHRRSFPIDYEMDDIIHEHAEVTIFAISSTRLNAIEAVKTLGRDGIKCNLVHLLWLKPFEATEDMLDALFRSHDRGLVLDGDFENGVAKCVAYDLMRESGSSDIEVLCLEERAAGFAPHLDNLPPTEEKICKKVKEMLRI